MRRTKIVLAAVAAVTVLVAGNGLAGQKGDGKEQKKSRFEMLKSLAGEWTGKAEHIGGEAFDATVNYKLTSAGSTVMETLFPGTAHEMVTMYHLNGEELLLTHYCAVGNQPRMRAERGGDPKKLSFKFLDGTNLKADKDLHMHEATIEFIDDDHIKSEWVTYSEGKPAGSAKFDLKRTK